MESDSKVLEYEKFLNERLRKDLRDILEHRDKLCEEVAEYFQLKSTIQKIQEDISPTSQLKTKIDLGCNFYVQANVPDPSMINVAIGCGFFVEMSLPEALTFIDKKTQRLQDHVAQLTTDACKVKGHIRLVLEGLRELQHFATDSTRPHRDVLS